MNLFEKTVNTGNLDVDLHTAAYKAECMGRKKRVPMVRFPSKALPNAPNASIQTNNFNLTKSCRYVTRRLQETSDEVNFLIATS